MTNEISQYPSIHKVSKVWDNWLSQLSFLDKIGPQNLTWKVSRVEKCRRFNLNKPNNYLPPRFIPVSKK